MLKARNKKVSLILVLAMMMTMFAGLGAASATDMYSVGSVPTIDDGAGQKLGSIIVNAYNFENTGAGAALSDIDVNDVIYGRTDKGFLVKLPDDFVITQIGSQTFESEDPFGAADTIAVVTPFTDKGADKAKVFVVSTAQANRVKVIVASVGDIEELKFTIPMTVTAPSSVPDEVKANIAKEPGSAFSDGLGILVATAAAGSVQAIANDPITITANDNEVEISVRANTDSALDEISFRLPAGFTWDSNPTMVKSSSTVTATRTEQNRKAEFDFSGNNKGIWTFKGQFDVDESRAKFGDVVITLSGSDVTPSTITVGTYADYGIEVKTSDAPTLLAGRDELEIADITIKETAAGSLIDGRTVTMTLPDGARWMDNAGVAIVEDVEDTGSLSLTASDITVYANKKTVAKFAVENNMNALEKGSLKIEAAQIELAPDFAGDLKVKLSGSGGVDEEITVAKVVAPVTVNAEKKDVKIGLQAQAGGNIVITESQAEALDSTDLTGTGTDGYLELTAPTSVSWAKLPTVKVIEGDVELGTVSKSGRNLSIRIKETSTVASKIEISDVQWTVDRTVPEGDMKVSVAGSAVVGTDFDNRDNVTSFVAANVVTPAPGDTLGNGQFKINSNIYYVGGVAKVMDVAPYIKGSRTYVPMRYLAEIIGAEVVWDATAKTVTLTKGDTVAVFTIGSTSYTINGEAKTADVAPEIANDRTMLPARFVAEAFGAVVGWDVGTQTVLIQK